MRADADAGHSWFSRVTTLDRHLGDCLRSSDTAQFAAAEDGMAELERRVRYTVLDSPPGPILITTSTAGGRPSSHEVGADLLGHVLSAVRAAGPARRVLLGDGTAYGQPYRTECDRHGWTDVARAHDVEIIDLNASPASDVGFGWMAADPFLTSSLTVVLTKGKTHRRFGISGCEKASLGFLSGGHHGHPKLKGGHEWVPWLIERLATGSSPSRLHVVDGRKAIEGEGPLRGRPVPSSFLLFGSSAKAVDITLAVQMGFDPALVPSLLRPAPEPRSLDVPHWPALRSAGAVDFLPTRSCAWLYRSLREPAQHRREKVYGRLLRSVLLASPPGLSAPTSLEGI